MYAWQPVVRLAIGSFAFASSTAMAQSASANRELLSGGFTPLVLAVSDSFQFRNADAVLVRRVNVEPHDVVVIRDGRATPALLAAAVQMAIAVRSTEGLQPSADGVYRVRVGGAAGRQREAQRWMRNLDAKPRRVVAGIGMVRWIELLVPDTAVAAFHRAAPARD